MQFSDAMNCQQCVYVMRVYFMICFTLMPTGNSRLANSGFGHSGTPSLPFLSLPSPPLHSIPPSTTLPPFPLPLSFPFPGAPTP